jgi:hypothetical protein
MPIKRRRRNRKSLCTITGALTERSRRVVFKKLYCLSNNTADK